MSVLFTRSVKTESKISTNQSCNNPKVAQHTKGVPINIQFTLTDKKAIFFEKNDYFLSLIYMVNWSKKTDTIFF